MKKPLALFGLLLFAFPLVGYGASMSLTDATPVTPYVRHVVDRVKQGFAEAEKGTSGGGTLSSWARASWLDRIASAVLSTVDTDLRIVAQERDLIDNTACLHADLAILEAWIEKARTEKNAALEAGNTRKILYLIPLQHYLNARYKFLLAGAVDPTLADTSEGRWFGFDAFPGYCCPVTTGNDRVCTPTSDAAAQRDCTFGGGNTAKSLNACVHQGCSSPDEASTDAADLCPFSTDYLPPTGAGYGCDSDVMRRIQANGLPSLGKELEALDAFVTARDQYLTNIASLQETTATIAATLGLPEPDTTNFQGGMSDRRTHRVLEGCQNPETPLPPGVVVRERRNAFSFAPDDLRLLPRLVELWRSWGAERLPPANLQTAEELGQNSSLQSDAKQMEGGVFGWLSIIVRNHARTFLQRWSIDQAEQESLLQARTQDAPYRLREEMQPLTQEVLTFSKTVQNPTGGIRGFVAGFAQFLRVSCVFRPCSEKLDRILKIDFTDACFPYASGMATGTEDAAAACMAAAGL
ncbi:MAG: hypothetical protein WCG83_07395 [Candidatus Peregrinibacteria bacterium]